MNDTHPLIYLKQIMAVYVTHVFKLRAWQLFHKSGMSQLCETYITSYVTVDKTISVLLLS